MWPVGLARLSVSFQCEYGAVCVVRASFHRVLNMCVQRWVRIKWGWRIGWVEVARTLNLTLKRTQHEALDYSRETY